MHTMTFQLDSQDNRHIRQAMAIRSKGVMPDSDAGPEYEVSEGALIAEICRGWMEFMGIEIESAPDEAAATSPA